MPRTHEAGSFKFTQIGNLWEKIGKTEVQNTKFTLAKFASDLSRNTCVVGVICGFAVFSGTLTRFLLRIFLFHEFYALERERIELRLISALYSSSGSIYGIFWSQKIEDWRFLWAKKRFLVQVFFVWRVCAWLRVLNNITEVRLISAILDWNFSSSA